MNSERDDSVAQMTESFARLAMIAGAKVGLMETHRMLQECGMNTAADRLMLQWNDIITRVAALHDAGIAIVRAQHK